MSSARFHTVSEKAEHFLNTCRNILTSLLIPLLTLRTLLSETLIASEKSD